MKPVVALIGRPNVGKSTLFNRLTGTRAALVADVPGLTRDRIYGHARCAEREFIVIDTGGLTSGSQGIEQLMGAQAELAMREADFLFFLVEARAGPQAEDHDIALRMRRLGKPVWLLVNKAEGYRREELAEFYELGLGEPHPVSALRGSGVERLVRSVIPDSPLAAGEDAGEVTRVAIIGRPNAGKSSLINRLLGEERLLTFDEPGTTRDSVMVDFQYDGRDFQLVDTAGVRRRGKIRDDIERSSVVRTIQALEQSHVVVLLIDAAQELAEQDLRLLSLVLDRGKALVVAVNKWDLLDQDQRLQFRTEVDRRLPFLDFAAREYISALRGTNLGALMKSVDRARRAAFSELATPRLTALLNEIVRRNPPPVGTRNRIKLKYAHQGGKNPPLIVIHGNQTGVIPPHYQKYLENAFRDQLGLEGTPLRIQFRSGDNPFQGRTNPLTGRQIKKKHRQRRFARKAARRSD